jgi:hypothetical protein
MASSSIEALSVLLELGMRVCSAFIFSLILLLLLFSERLCTSAARLLLPRGRAGLAGSDSDDPSAS